MNCVLRSFVRPEFINRVDEIIVFHFLTRDDILKIVDVQIGDLNERLAERKLTLELAGEARELLAERGFDPDFGARPLKRLLQRSLLDPLARLVIEGEVDEGDTIRAVVRDGGIALEAPRRS